MTRFIEHTAAAFAALLIVTALFVPTLSVPPAELTAAPTAILA
jgi:hypothetical protein